MVLPPSLLHLTAELVGKWLLGGEVHVVEESDVCTGCTEVCTVYSGPPVPVQSVWVRLSQWSHIQQTPSYSTQATGYSRIQGRRSTSEMWELRPVRAESCESCKMWEQWEASRQEVLQPAWPEIESVTRAGQQCYHTGDTPGHILTAKYHYWSVCNRALYYADYVTMWLCPLSENISVPCLGWSCPAWWAENQNILTEILLIRQVTEDGESDYSYYSWLVVWWHGDDGHQTASSGRYFSPITPARSRFKWYQTGEILCSWWDLNDPHLSFVTLTIDVGLCWWRPCS